MKERTFQRFINGGTLFRKEKHGEYSKINPWHFCRFWHFSNENDNNDKSDTPPKKHTMSTHIFILEPYKGVSTRHTCPNCHRQRCFSKYIDTEKHIKFPEYVQRCDHEQKCGYHFSPRDYFEQNPSEKEKFTEDSFRSYTPIREVQPIATSYIDLDIVNQSLRSYPANKLFQFLSAQSRETETIKLMKRYKIGTSKYFPNEISQCR